MGNIFSRQHFEMFFFFFFFFFFFLIFSRKQVLKVPAKLYPMETICIKCQILFSGKSKKKVTNLSSPENFSQSAKHLFAFKAGKCIGAKGF